MANEDIEKAHIKEVITPQANQSEDGFELWDLDHDGIPDVYEDDEDVDASSDARRRSPLMSRRAFTFTVPATEEDGGYGDGAAYDDDYDEEDGCDEDDDYDEEDGEEEDPGPEVAFAFRPDAPERREPDELPVINGKRVERRKKPRPHKDPEFDLTHPDYTLTITKGLTNTVVKRKYYPHNRALLTVVMLFLAGIALLCFLVFSVVYMVGNERLKKIQAAELEQLTEENRLLASRNNELSSTVTQLSRSVNRSIEDRRADEIAYEESLIPNEWPLSGEAEVQLVYESEVPEIAEETGEETEEETDGAANGASSGTSQEADAEASDDSAGEASTEEAEDGEAEEETPDTKTAGGVPVALFVSDTAQQVLVTGGGSVTRILEDETYGQMVMIDHRNGYVSIYRSEGDVQVTVGDMVVRGDVLILQKEAEATENTQDAAEADTGDTGDAGDAAAGCRLAYQVLLNDNYLNPLEMIPRR